MATLSGSRIFTVGGTAYVWEDVVLAAHLWGDWTALEQRVRDGLACLARLDEDDEDGLDEADVDAAGTEFRYARDLVAAADLEADTLAMMTARAGDDALDRALPELPREVRRERLERLLRLEAAWRRFSDRVAPPQALRGVIAARRLDWVRVGVRAVVAPDNELAREIVLCVREDHRSIEEVAAEAGLSAETAEWWLEDVEPVVRDALLGVLPGDVVGPVSAKQGHLVLRVADKRLPSDDDEAVRARAEQALLARTVEHEMANRVIWHQTL